MLSPENTPKDLDGNSAFTNCTETVINYKGENYYKSCGFPVKETSVGTSHCVKRVGHKSDHEDWNGTTKENDERTGPSQAVGQAS